MEKRYYWMKLKEDFFTTPRIKKLRKVPGGDTFVMIYLKMAMLSLNSDAVLVFEHIENTFVEEIALKIDEDENSVFITVEFLEKTGLMVEIAKDRYKLVEIEDCIGSESSSALRQRKSRELRKVKEMNAIPENMGKCDNVTSTSRVCTEIDPTYGIFKENKGISCDNVTPMSQECNGEKTGCDNVTHVSHPCHTDIDIDIDIEKKKETYVSKEKEFPENRFEEKVIDEFIELLLRNEPLLRVPVTEEQKKKWYDPIEKLRERGYTEADILNTMRYTLTNNFWKAHILTPEKFKIKFSQLLLKYRSEQTQQAKPSFNNFTGRQYDMEQLEMELLQTGTSTKV